MMAYRLKYTITDLRTYAAAQGGKCLSATYNGAKASYKWQCASGHEWMAAAGPIILRRTWCAKCALLKYSIEDLRNCAAEKGGHCLSPIYKGVKSHYQWRCAKGHEWMAIAAPIINRGVWCPDCAQITSGNKLRRTSVQRRGSLVDHYPDIVSEWDRERNTISPEEVPPKSSLKAWWICQRGHRWQTTIASRTHMQSGCPKCISQTSRFELCLFAELQSLYGDVEWRAKLIGMECDVYIRSLNLGIEIDGGYWHANRGEQDRTKTDRFAVKGISLLRVRDTRLPEIHGHVILYNNREQPLRVAGRVVAWIYERYPTPVLGEYLKLQHHLGKRLYQAMLANLPGPPPGQTLVDTHPSVAFGWDVAANYPLTPSMFSSGSNYRAFWSCSCGNSWRAQIYSRTALRAGCPRCGQEKSIQGRKETLLRSNRSFAARHPELLYQWASNKNGSADPQVIMAGNQKTHYWWKCDRGHEWQATCKSRHAGYGCPTCARQTQGDRRRQGDLTRRGTSLAVLYPSLVDEWDNETNTLSPDQVLAKSSHRAYWTCSKGHRWQAVIASRTAGTGCPVCKIGKFADAVGQRAIQRSGSLASVISTLPFELVDSECKNSVTPGSHKIVRWRCRAGHIFQRAVRLVVRGLPCPSCRRK